MVLAHDNLLTGYERVPVRGGLIAMRKSVLAGLFASLAVAAVITTGVLNPNTSDHAHPALNTVVHTHPGLDIEPPDGGHGPLPVQQSSR